MKKAQVSISLLITLAAYAAFAAVIVAAAADSGNKISARANAEQAQSRASTACFTAAMMQATGIEGAWAPDTLNATIFYESTVAGFDNNGDNVTIECPIRASGGKTTKIGGIRQ